MNKSTNILHLLDTLANLGKIPEPVFAFVHVETDPVKINVKRVLSRKKRKTKK